MLSFVLRVFARSVKVISRSSLFVRRIGDRQLSQQKQRMAGQICKEHNLVWVDLEMSGLDVEKERILEMACLVTDAQLNIIAEGPSLIIHQSDDVLDSMDEWCTQHHWQSGLTAAVRKSIISESVAEKQMLGFIKEHTATGKCPLAGNSVHGDKAFLQKYMQEFVKHLHYRIVDVSTIKELCRRWYPKDFHKAPQKKLTHRALEDIKESITELKYYRETIFSDSSKC